MRRWIIGALLASALFFLIGRSVIADRGKDYLGEILEACNNARAEDLRLELASYRKGWSGAEAQVRIHTGNAGIKDPLLLGFGVEYGPVFFGALRPGLIRLESEGSVSRWLNADASGNFLKSVPGDISYRYEGVLDWWHVLHEKIALSRIEAYNPKRRERWILEPLRIRSDYEVKTLRGRAEFVSSGALLTDEKSGERLEVKRPRLGVVIREFNAAGPVFGSFAFSAAEVTALLKGAHPRMLRFDGGMKLSLNRENTRLATLAVAADAHALNAETRNAWRGLGSARLDIRLESLGIRGIEKFMAMEKQRRKIRRELARAVGIKDDVAMQKAILALQALDNRWIGAFNHLFIPGKTRLVWDETLQGDRESRLHLDLTFTGEKLPDDPFSAMVALTTGLDRMAEGTFDLKLEKKLLKNLLPQGAMILDSMVRKGLATLKEGIYHLKGSINAGKIVIGGTRYAPRELIMMILI